MPFFKIRQKDTTEWFSSGGGSPRWTKQGKVWTSLARVRQHLAEHDSVEGWLGCDYTDGEIVEFEVVVKSVIDMATTRKQIADLLAGRKAARAEAARKETERAEKAQLSKLKKKYPDAV